MIEPTLHLTHDQFDRARELIEERAGIYCPDSREQVLRRALAARMHLCAIADWRHYLQLLTSAATGDAEFRQLLRYITISETSFFRIPSQFQALRQVLVPSIVAASPAGTLNIWSAGCSTGEEPYSIAITLEDMGAALRRWQVHILATDVRPEAVECGRLGRYRERALRGASRDHRARYFARRDDEYEVSPHLRQRVRFQELNLAAPRYPRPAPNGWDIIFCRNVTMYFRPQTARQVIARFREALRPGGFLVLSPTECLCTVSTAFEIIEAAGAFIYVKPPLDAALAALRPSGAAPHAPAADAHPRPPQGVGARHALPLPCPARRPAASEGEAERQACARAVAAAAADLLEEAEHTLLPFAADPRAVRARSLLAWVRALRGEWEQAAAGCMELLAHDALLAPAHYILGRIAGHAGEADESEEHFAKAIYSDSGLVPAHYYLGVARAGRGDNEGALRAFRGALRALGEGNDAWLDFSEGLTREHWRHACEERLAAAVV